MSARENTYIKQSPTGASQPFNGLPAATQAQHKKQTPEAEAFWVKHREAEATSCKSNLHNMSSSLVSSFIINSERLLVRASHTPLCRGRVPHTKVPTWSISVARRVVLFELSSQVPTLVTMDVFSLEVWQDCPCSGATFSSSSSYNSS